MKKILLSILIVGFTFAFSQETSNLNLQESNVSQTKLPLSEFDTPAEFPGGMNAFRMYISNNLKTDSFDNVSGKLKADIKFKITTEGKIQDITATGSNTAFNNEMIRVIKSIKTKWKPATRKGQPVDNWFTFPMNMQIH